MPAQPKIAIYEPKSANKERYFTLRLKGQLEKERSVFPTPEKMLIIPPLRGDFHLLTSILRKYNVIDSKNKWTFGDGHLVLTGNCIENGINVSECLWFIYGLEERAFKKGGHLHFILGHNELVNIDGDWRHEQPNYAFTKRKLSSRAYAIIFDGNNELYRWLHTKNVIEKIGAALFSGGEAPLKTLQAGATMADINKTISNRILPAEPAKADQREGPSVLNTAQIKLPGETEGINAFFVSQNSSDGMTVYLEKGILRPGIRTEADDLEAILARGAEYYCLLRNGGKIRLADLFGQ